MNDLKPCPFCGGEATIARSAWFDQVTCKECRVSTAPCRTVDEAIEAWNTRAERTCHVEGSYYDELMDENYTDLSCGHHLRGAEWEFDFCSRCGAKVVGE